MSKGVEGGLWRKRTRPVNIIYKLLYATQIKDIPIFGNREVMKRPISRDFATATLFLLFGDGQRLPFSVHCGASQINTSGGTYQIPMDTIIN
jgi:hypothetical protein